MESKIILLNEPGKIITPFPIKEANSLTGRKQVRSVEQVAKDVYDKMSDEEKEKVKANFEEKFGSNPSTRTKEQWCNLVSMYGPKQVAKIEKMTVKQVVAKCGLKVNSKSKKTKNAKRSL